MKVTSQTRSPTWVTPTVCPANNVTEIDLAAFEAQAAAIGDGHTAIVERVPELLEAAIDAR